MPSYVSFAQYYDGLMEDAQYKKRCDYILELAKRHNHTLGLTLDLACGTGSLTRELYRRGIDVYGVDGSAEMLSEAMQMAAKEEMNILYLRQKMQCLNLYGTINTCVCTLDSINHLIKADDVRITFDRVGLFMDNNGLFVFDVNTVYKHRKVLADNTYIIETENVYCVWQNCPEENDIINITLDFFEEENGVYYRSCESFSERAYDDALLREMLESAGFEVEAVYGDLSFDAPAEDEQRAIYVARMRSSRNSV